MKEFFIHNFVLLCMAIVMIVNAVMHYSQNKRISLCSILITACCIILAISVSVEDYGKPRSLYYLTLTFAIIGYIVRPLCIYLFILMNKKAYRGKYSFLIWIPLVVNAIIYLLAYIPAMKGIVFGFDISSNTGDLKFHGGPLRFSSHIISLVYLGYLFYLSIFTLKSKHIMHGITIMVCVLFVIAAVVMETFFSDGTVEILNATIMVSTLTYYLFLYKENMQIDTLTGLFNRETYYHDLPKMDGSANGVIQFDINGLKYLNDNYGHFEGDKAISTIADLILKSTGRGMYAYRLGGDEFLVIANNCSKEDIEKTISVFKEKLGQTKYYCSVGYAYDESKLLSVEELMQEAEKVMYQEKNNFYTNSPFERRKV